MKHFIEPGHRPRMALQPKVYDVAPLVAELDAHPELWNEYTLRTQDEHSPHRESQDIWIRYNAIENLDRNHPRRFNDEHVAVWYPCTEKIPLVRAMAQQIAVDVGAIKIGAVLVTRIPAGRQIHWHSDHSWHADNHRKFLLLLKGVGAQSFEFEGERMHAEPGDCFEFQNAFPHRVMNPSPVERVSLIVCVRDFTHKV